LKSNFVTEAMGQAMPEISAIDDPPMIEGKAA
jgi:hypothetical protein